MTLLFTLKYIADAAFYMTFAAFAAGRLGAGGLGWQTLLLCAAAPLCRLLDRRREPLRLLPLALLLGLLFLPGGYVALLLSLPPAAFLGWMVWKRLFVLSRGDEIDQFLLLLKLLPLPFLFLLIVQQGPALRRWSFPYLMIFLFSSVLLLRMLRHDEAVLRQKRFRALNALEVGGAGLLAAVLVAPQSRHLMAETLRLVYRYLIGPLLMLIGYLFVGFGWLISGLVKKLSGLFTRQDKPQLTDKDPLAEQLKKMTEAADGRNSDLAARILIALAIAAAAVCVFLLFRRLLSGRRGERAADGTETRETLPAAHAGTRARRFPLARTPAEQVRRSYRRYLLFARAAGAQLNPCQNTLQQRLAAGDSVRGHGEEQTALRALYLDARYADRAGREEARRARALSDAVRRGKQ